MKKLITAILVILMLSISVALADGFTANVENVSFQDNLLQVVMSLDGKDALTRNNVTFDIGGETIKSSSVATLGADQHVNSTFIYVLDRGTGSRDVIYAVGKELISLMSEGDNAVVITPDSMVKDAVLQQYSTDLEQTMNDLLGAKTSGSVVAKVIDAVNEIASRENANQRLCLVLLSSGTNPSKKDAWDSAELKKVINEHHLTVYPVVCGNWQNKAFAETYTALAGNGMKSMSVTAKNKNEAVTVTEQFKKNEAGIWVVTASLESMVGKASPVRGSLSIKDGSTTQSVTFSIPSSVTALIRAYIDSITPEATPVPTAEPTAEPTEEPTPEPTEEPTAEPTAAPTEEPDVFTQAVNWINSNLLLTILGAVLLILVIVLVVLAISKKKENNTVEEIPLRATTPVKRGQEEISEYIQEPEYATVPAAKPAVKGARVSLLRLDNNQAITHDVTSRATIGRSKDCTFVLTDNQHISRVNAELTYSDGKLYIRDMNSTSGTMVNGNKITSVTILKQGDKLGFANTLCVISWKAQ